MRTSLLILACLLIAVPAASQSTGPRLGVATRALTEEERLLNSVESTDAIVVARVLSVTEELVERIASTDTDEHFALVAYSLIRVEEIVFSDGLLQPNSILAVPIPGQRHALFEAAAGSTTPMLLFLRQFEVAQSARSPSRGVIEFVWANVWKTHIPGEGALSLDHVDRSARIRSIKLAYELAKPRNLAKRADLVVRGHHEGSPAVRTANSAGQICANIVVDEILYGTTSETALPVFTTVPGYVRAEESVYFLKRTPEGPYEVVGLSGGVRVVTGNRMGRRKDDLRTVRRELKEAKKSARSLAAP